MMESRTLWVHWAIGVAVTTPFISGSVLPNSKNSKRNNETVGRSNCRRSQKAVTVLRSCTED